MSSDKPSTADNLRERAEALLAKSPGSFRPEDLKDVNKLAHELAVHQAELELQNDELRNTQLALQQTRDRYAALFEDAPVGYVVLDGSGIIRQTNATWCAMLGRPDEDFRGTPFAETLLPEDAPIFLARFRALFRNPAEKQIILRIKRRGSPPIHAQIEARPSDPGQDGVDDGGPRQELMVIVSDITERRQAEEELKKMEWMLTDRPPADRAHSPARDDLDQGYGDLTLLNRDGLIARSLDKDTLADISAEYLNLLETSSAIYEKNGDYAYGIFTSGWCRLLDRTSRKLCRTDDNEDALVSGKWLCHESCWTDCSLRAIESRSPADVECHGGIHIYAVPIFSAGEVIGAINFGYGDPPRDEAKLKAVAEAYDLDPEELAREAEAYPSRPSYIIELAKQRLLSSARLIGLMVERKQAEEALRESEQRLRSVFNAVDGVPIQGYDMERRVLFWNPASEKLYGYTPEEALGRKLEDLIIPEEAREQTVEAIRRWHDEAIPIPAGEIELLNKQGDLLQVYSNHILVTNRHGAKEMFCIDVDLTDRKRAEQALQRSESLFQTMLALIPDMISIHDPDMNVVYSNWNGFASVAPERRIMGEKCYRVYRELDSICPDCRAKRVLETREPFAEEVELPEGRWVELQAIPILDANGDCELFVEWVRDVTERKETEDRLRQMEKMDAIGQLAGGVAHDFNNQLAGVMGYADLLRDCLEDPVLQRYAENILVSSRRAGDLTQKLLAFARKGQYRSVSVDIHEIVHEVVGILNHSIDKRIEIKQILEAAPCSTKGDPGQIQNALLNLAINASDAMEEGGKLVFETAVAELDSDYCRGVPYDMTPGAYLCLSISDTGCGIPKESLDRVFEPFFTTKEVGKGTGMGLAAVYGTVKQHGGAINIYSEVGLGTTFRIYLPLEAEAAPPVQRNSDIVAAPRSATILVVDDEAIIRQLAEDFLRDLGYQVETREDGASGLSYYEKHWQEIDLVILDMVMPRLNGPETYKAMKAINPDVKVILASGYSINGAAQELLTAGVQGFIQKPFERAAMSAKVAETLQGGFG